MDKIIIATKNEGKISEFKALFAKRKVDVLSLLDLDLKIEIIEDGNTFFDNALKKAKTIYDIYHVPVIADDSGLEVDVLNGEPGVYSHRYLSESATYAETNQYLISKLKEINADKYLAQFKCVMVYYSDGKIVSSEGIMKGEIILDPRGDKGFGYDPIFLVPEYQKTLAELDLETKNKISHRYKALKILFEELNK